MVQRSQSNKSNTDGKDESKIQYDEEEDTILDEKRLQILTTVTFRDLFQRKIKILEMRKRELFNKSLVYLDYDTVKIINIKNKGIWIGWIYEIQKAIDIIESQKQGDDSNIKLTAALLNTKSMSIYQKIIKLGMNKSSVTDYKDYTQKIREFLAIKWFYQGCKTLMGEVANLRVFDGVPILVDYKDYVNSKDISSYKEYQSKRQSCKDKILKYVTLIGRFKGIQYILKVIEKPEEMQKESLYEYLNYSKSELDKINSILISEWLYKAYKLRNILREYYSSLGQLAICDWIQKQLEPFYLPLYFKLYWYIDSWNIIFMSIIEKEKISLQYTPTAMPSKPTHQSLSRASIMTSPNTGRKLSSRVSGPNANKSSIKLNELISKDDLKLKFERSTMVYNKLQRIQQLIIECDKYGWDKVKEDWNIYLDEEQDEITFITRLQSYSENNERKTKSSLGRRKTNELKLESRASYYNITKEQIEGEQYIGYADTDKEK